MTDNPETQTTPPPPILFPLTLYPHEYRAFERGELKRLIRYEAPTHSPDRTDIHYVVDDARFRLVKPWRCHKPEVVEVLETEEGSQPLTMQQLAENGTTSEAFTAWYEGVLEREKKFRPPHSDFLPPPVWLATIERVGEE